MLEHVSKHARNPMSDYSNGFVAGWLSYKRKAAPAVFVGALVFGWLLGLATAAVRELIWERVT